MWDSILLSLIIIVIYKACCKRYKLASFKNITNIIINIMHTKNFTVGSILNTGMHGIVLAYVYTIHWYMYADII
jgi:hypothetical protein